MARWFDRMMGSGRALLALSPREALSLDRSRTMKQEDAVTAESGREKIRELLRLELDCAADSSLRTGNLTAAKILRKLAETTRHVDVSVLQAYAQLLDDIVPGTSSDELRNIGSGWFPESAAEYVQRLVLVQCPDRISLQTANKRKV